MTVVTLHLELVEFKIRDLETNAKEILREIEKLKKIVENLKEQSTIEEEFVYRKKITRGKSMKELSYKDVVRIKYLLSQEKMHYIVFGQNFGMKYTYQINFLLDTLIEHNLIEIYYEGRKKYVRLANGGK